MVTMVDHLLGHATIDAYVLACNETSLVGTKKLHHVYNVHGVTDTPCGLLHSIGTFIERLGGINPSG